MPTAAIVFSDGCEEIEGLSQVDVLRRLGIPCLLAELRPLVGARFQVLFHSSVRSAFHLSLTVLVHYRSLGSI